MDLLLGTWAEDNLMKLSNSQVEEYEKILEQDTRDLYNWLLDKEELPDVRHFTYKKGGDSVFLFHITHIIKYIFNLQS